jgi:hypothetical protein
VASFKVLSGGIKKITKNRYSLYAGPYLNEIPHEYTSKALPFETPCSMKYCTDINWHPQKVAVYSMRVTR